MDKFTDNEVLESEGLYSREDTEGIEFLEKSKRILDFTLLCNKVCFPHYKLAMTNEEAVCHDKCYKNLFSTYTFCQKRFVEENNIENQQRL